ncbi:hypothetical protein IscW_ISCW009694 [Ixodes scapularis]|uniref:Uncharacterized protein n=1 Tax=Ixodes scapularis TaxID=6945 RepID=B7Q0P0_IXOSC|nr:hypothetical protein IscW_ISCW009694 [Ixodes scapularis]|eukprot:XP_002408081.1 hypothetical protein IscW_ISCW009694 [Ixodes scapularis]
MLVEGSDKSGRLALIVRRLGRRLSAASGAGSSSRGRCSGALGVLCSEPACAYCRPRKKVQFFVGK